MSAVADRASVSPAGPLSRLARLIAQMKRTARLTATEQITEGPLFVLDYALRLARVGVLVAIWQTLLGGGGSTSGFTLAAALTYTLIAEVFAEPLAGETGLDVALWEGAIAMRLLRPFSLVAQFAAESAGRWSFGLVTFSIPLLLLAPALGVDFRPASPSALAAFVPSLLLAICVGLALDFIFGALFIIVDINVWVIRDLRHALATLLSGALLPLPLYPWGLGEIFGYLPFAAQASAPLRIYTGTGDPASLLLSQLAWAVALGLLARWLWIANRERLVCYGG